MAIRKLLAGILVLLGISFVATQSPAPKAGVQGELTVAFLDVGQGDAILLTTPNRKHILIDGGPDATILTRLGEELRFNERTIDLAIVSHNHSDHIEGLNHVIPRYDVAALWISGAIHTTNEYLELLNNIKTYGIPTEVVWQGSTATVDGVVLDVVHPIQNMHGIRPEDQHDATLVVRASFGNKSFLFTGDIDEGHEQAMLQTDAPLKADVLKVAHHGSKSGLALNFLQAVSPTYAVIQSGKENRFGHPAQSILDKLTSFGVQIFRNDEQGTIYARTDGTNLTLSPR